MKVEGKVVVVTGAGSGMGRELALGLVRRGAKVAAVDLNEVTLRETQALAAVPKSQLATFTLDITDRAAVEALPKAVVAKLGAVDGVINCAGIIQKFVRVNELDYASIERVMNVNWWGTVQMTKAFLPSLLKRPEAHVVNISSMGGFLPVPGQTIYGASKAAVKLFTEGLSSELKDTNVHVTVVFPGAVATNITANSGVEVPSAPKEGKPRSAYPANSAAKDILDGMERNRFRVLVGSDSKLLDKLYRLNPKRAATFIAKQMKDLLG
ncbi:MAG: SDR family NAD(P)-dependent oxidoreductase [Myxococcus sp.]|nr:SDR family NAD(P)-dependent oxidoreductase [Myxococcus sp.]